MLAASPYIKMGWIEAAAGDIHPDGIPAATMMKGRARRWSDAVFRLFRCRSPRAGVVV